MKLVSSDWFSIFLTYLDKEEILRLDSAFCNHNSRIEWLNLLNTLKPSIIVKNNQFTNKIADWLILKNVYPVELTLKFIRSHVALSDDCVFKLTRNGSRLKKFEIVGDYYETTIVNKMIFPYVAAYCTQLNL